MVWKTKRREGREEEGEEGERRKVENVHCKGESFFFQPF
jgi:hypothetical protein